jgi:hypothetical protein
MTRLIVAFRNFAHAPKNGKHLTLVTDVNNQVLSEDLSV